MSSFINSIIDRSTEPVQSIQPRLRGKFERDLTPPDIFARNSTSAFNTGEQTHTPDEKFPVQRRDATVRTSLSKNMIDEPAEDSHQSYVSKPSQQSTEQKDDVSPEKPPRFEPSSKIIVPQNIPEQNSERKVSNDDNVNRQPDIKPTVDEVRSVNDQQQKRAVAEQPQSPSIAHLKTTVTKEVYKPLPVVKAAAHLITPAEAPGKVNLKQPAASFMNQKTPAATRSSTINISIGRIEVRVSQPPAQLPAKPKNEGVAIMSLDEYLQKRNQGS